MRWEKHQTAPAVLEPTQYQQSEKSTDEQTKEKVRGKSITAEHYAHVYRLHIQLSPPFILLDSEIALLLAVVLK